MVIEIIQREVPVRGIGYIILRDCPEERLGEALGKGMEKLKKAGAKRVWATSLPEGEPLHPGAVGVWRLTHVHDILRMDRPLSDLPPAEGKLTLRPAKKVQEENTYLELVNRAFQDVPNAATQRKADLRLPNHRHGLALRGNEAVGAYEIDLSDKVPELAALAIDPPLRRQGLGKTLLLTLLDSLTRTKAESCCLRVSSLNAPALALYRGAGFTQTGVVSSWFEVV